MNAANKPQTAKDVIKAYLDRRAAEDPQFATTYAKPNKNIDECYRYILGEARQHGTAVCLTDDVVFGMAVHYYDEDDIKIRPTSAARTSVGATAPATPTAQKQKPKQTPEQKAEARRRKQEEGRREAIRKKQPYSPSLFDFDDL